MNCIFCRISKKEMPADIIYENERIISFRDIKPLAPLHLLIVPKKHISSIDHLESQDKELIGELFLAAKKIARDQGVAKSGYKLVFNVGEGGGQIINHLHLHLLGGWKNSEEKKVPGMP